METLELKTGQIISGRYEVLTELGHGGMGLVFLVKQILVGKEFALKTLDKISETSLRRFRQEARAMFAVDHPNLIAVKDFGIIDDNIPFLVMELLKGETLHDRLKRTCPLPLEEALIIAEQVCLGLSCAHDFGIIHRDVKPSNIFLVRGLPLGTEGSIKVLDFGIAKFTSHEEGEVQALTKTGEIFGSPPYMSPEQCSGSRVDHRSDVYSLGCVLFECLTGAPPFVGNSAIETMMKRYSDSVPTLREASLGREYPPQLEYIVSKMLAQKPEHRYQSIGLLAQDLSAVRRGDALAATKSTRTQELTIPAGGFSKSPRTTNLSWFAILIAAVIISSVVTHGIDTAPPPVKPEHVDPFDIEGAHSQVPVKIPDFDKESEQRFQQQLLQPNAKRTVTFEDFELDEQKFKDIANTGWIEKLDIRHCKISNGALRHLQKMNLLYLNISYTNLDDSGAAAIANCLCLKRLRLSGTEMTSTGFLRLRNLQKLVWLDLSRTNVTDEVVSELAKIPNLQSLLINECPRVSRACLSDFERRGIKELQIEGLEIAPLDIHLLSHIPSLKVANLSRTAITFDEVSELCSEAPDLVSVIIHDCPNLKPIEIGKLKLMFSKIAFHLST